jgi:hypothetical protein
MFEIIKSLSVKQRLIAFIVAVVFTSLVSLGTIYLQTDDCSAISKQYKGLVQEQADLLKINNDLIQYSNQARKDFLEIQIVLSDLQKSMNKTQTVERVRNSESMASIRRINSDTISQEPIVIVKEKMVIKGDVKEAQKCIEKGLNIVNKYDSLGYE